MLPDVNELVAVLKKSALETVEASKPVNICFGTVSSDKPLMINVEQKMTLGERQLILSRCVTEYKTTMSIEDEEKEITVKNGSAVGDEVILVRQQGGQKFIILDRIGSE